MQEERSALEEARTRAEQLSSIASELERISQRVHAAFGQFHT